MTEYRIGQGTDLHVLTEKRGYILGGIKIPYEKGFKAHSDGDVLIHAIIDALLGSLCLDDIGTHFPDNSEEYKNADSAVLLAKAVDMVRKEGWEINNIDSTIHAQAPKLRPYIYQIRENLARILCINVNQISVKAKTNEGVDAVGEKRAVSVDCSVLIRK